MSEEAPVGELVTVLFTDIEGSTRLARQLGPGGWENALAAHHRLVGEAIATHGGRVVQTEGDAFLAFFPSATAGVLAAIDGQQRLAGYGWGAAVGMLKVRMGLHTGVVERHSTGYVGLDLHLGARVAAAANGGQILMTATARRGIPESIETRDLGEHRLKDFPTPERLYDVVVEPGAAVMPPRTEPLRPTNLPPQTRRLVGRDRERAQVRELLDLGELPVVTITGLGGIGKTRLAVAVGSDLLDRAPGGVFIIRLAGIREVGAVVPMIAEALGISGDSGLSLSTLVAQRLSGRRTILILDNFEQLVSGASIVTELAMATPELRVLITSQVPLRIADECVFPLGPLASDDAVSLFAERARSRVGAFDLGDDDRAAILDICERLDGMPLAIELAAARAGSLGPQSLAARLESPLALLTRGDRDLPERHRSLRATIDWTYRLLDRGEQALFERLAVCAGAVPLPAVEAIAESGDELEAPLDALEALLECSLLRRQVDRRLGMRFGMPQALRPFALERLAAAGAEDAARERHAEYVATVAHAARLWKWGATPEQRAALLAVAAEIRPAVAWAREHSPILHVRLCAALAPYWVYRGVISEVSDEFRHARESGLGTADQRAWITTMLAKCEQLHRNGEAAKDLLDAALAEWREVPDEQERAIGWGDLSWVSRWASRHDEALALMEESVRILRRTGDRRLILRGLIFEAHVFADMKDVPATLAVVEEAAKLAGDDPTWELDAIRADCALFTEDYAGAIRLYGRSLSWTSESGESHQMLMDLRGLQLALAGGGFAEAALEVGELTRLREEETGRAGMPQDLAGELAESLTRARAQLGTDAADAAIARARATGAGQRIVRALELANQAAGREPEMTA